MEVFSYLTNCYANISNSRRAELSAPPGLESETVFGFVRCQPLLGAGWCGQRAVSLPLQVRAASGGSWAARAAHVIQSGQAAWTASTVRLHLRPQSD